MVWLIFAGPSIQLVPDGTLILHLVAIIVMVALLNATLLRPINRILAQRERLTRGRLSEAESTLLKVEEKMRDYERLLRETRAEGYVMMERQRAKVSAEREEKIANIRAEVRRQLSQEREQLKVETERVKNTLRSEARALAVEISRRILRRPISGESSTL